MQETDAPALTAEEAKEIVAGKTAPRVTEASIKDRIATATYTHIDQLTICVITMVNGFHVVGKAAPASPENYDQGVGDRYAFEDAFRQLWPLEGYLLRDRLHREMVEAQARKNAPTTGQEL